MPLNLRDTFTGAGKWVSQDEVSRAVVQMERNGFALDTAYCEESAKKAEADEAERREELYRWSQQLGMAKSREETEAVWSAPMQVMDFLHGHLKLPYSPIYGKGKLPDGKHSIDAKALEWVITKTEDKTVARGLRTLGTLRKIWSSLKYLRKLPLFVGPDGLIHPVCGQAGDEDNRVGAVTWRLAMKKPEGQQLPKNKRKDKYGVRKAIVPAGRGRLLVVNDFTALEVVILSHICQVLFNDDQLARSLLPEAPDFHSSNARAIFGGHLGWSIPQDENLYPEAGKRVDALSLLAFKSEGEEHPFAVWLRDLVKAVWYGLQYGKSDYGFASTLLDSRGDPVGLEIARSIIRALYATVPGIQRWQFYAANFVREHSGISGLNGAWCDLSSLVSGDDWDVRRAERRGMNYPMQEGGAAIIGHAMVNVLRNKDLQKMGYILRLQVHDELVGDAPAEHAEEASEIVQYEMENCFPWLRTQLRASKGVGANYYEAK